MKVCIIGMGLIGGSLGLALRKVRPRVQVVGVVRKKENIRKVLSRGAADQVFTDPRKAVQGARWIVLATRPLAFETILRKIVPGLNSSQIITDVGSVKQCIMQLYRKVLGKRIPYIGSHPIAGSEMKGIEAARKDLFKGAVCVLTPDRNTSSDTLKNAHLFWRSVQARPVVESEVKHDEILGYVSHLPHLISSCLVHSVLKKRAYLSFSGEAWRDMTRIAQSPSELWTEISLLNRSRILESIRHFSKDLDQLERALRERDASFLKDFFNRARFALEK